MSNFRQNNPSHQKTIVKKDAEFFISLCQSGKHSFVYVGVLDARQQVHTLSIIGKAFVERIGLVKWSSFLIDEYNCWLNLPNQKIKFKSFNLTYSQVVDYFDIVGAYNQTINHYNLSCDENNYYFTLLDNQCNYSDLRLSSANPNFLTLCNTCRHTAIEIIEQINQQTMVNNRQRQFFITPPWQGVMINGTLTAYPFYILPSPPNTNWLKYSLKKYRILKSLYSCLYRLAKKPSTCKENDYIKFSKLKELYNKLTELKFDSEQFISIIKTWESKNKEIIDTYRCTTLVSNFRMNYLASKTRTRKIINKLLYSP